MGTPIRPRAPERARPESRLGPKPEPTSGPSAFVLNDVLKHMLKQPADSITDLVDMLPGKLFPGPTVFLEKLIELPGTDKVQVE